MNGIKETKQNTMPKVEQTPAPYQQQMQQPIFQLPVSWNSISYGSINLQSNVEDMNTLVSWLKYMIDMERKRRPSYLG